MAHFLGTFFSTVFMVEARIEVRDLVHVDIEDQGPRQGQQDRNPGLHVSEVHGVLGDGAWKNHPGVWG